MSRKVTPTYTLINQITLAANTGTATFSNIPQNFSDLVISTTSTAASGGLLLIRLNADSGNNYNTVVMRGLSDGPASFAYPNEPGYISVSGYTNHSTALIHVLDYNVTDKHKTILSRSGYSNQTTVEATAIRWANTASVSSVSLALSAGNFGIGTTFSLYGVVA